MVAALVAATAASAALGGYTQRVRSRPVEHAAAPAAPAPPVPAPAPPIEVPAPKPAAEPPAPAPSPPPPSPPLPAARPAPTVGVLVPEVAGRYHVGEVIGQEVAVSRRSAFRVLGAGAPQTAEYTFASRLTVEAVGRDGSLVVRQRVESARLTACDPAMRATLDAALRKATGATFEIAVGPRGDVTDLKAPADPLRVKGGADAAGGPTFRVWSLLDSDGWKELAGLTFFQPDRPLAAGATWDRPLAHSWGPLGAWYGRTNYAAVGRRDGVERVEYAHAMTYRPPAGGGADLPFRVLRADFRPVAAGGAIRYDAARARVASAEEAFHVRGAVVVSVGGAEATVEVEEAQGFRLRVVEPAALEARPRR